MENQAEFWDKVEVLRLSLLYLFEDEDKSDRTVLQVTFPKRHTLDQRTKIIGQIEDIVENCTFSMKNGDRPSLTLINRNRWTNVMYRPGQGLQLRPDPVTFKLEFSNQKKMKKFAIMFHLLSKIYILLHRNTYSTKRDIYYQDPLLFGSQHAVDCLVEDIACMLGVPRRELHVLATSKGCIAGDLQFQDPDGNYVHCDHNTAGILVPTSVHEIRNIRSGARFILVVEKDATFQKLLDDGLTIKLNPCIIITGKGYPDVNTREMTRLLWRTLRIPVFALMDADPHGIEILCVYTYGSLGLAYDSENLVTPVIRWLGLLVTDLERLNIPRSSMMPLTQADYAKLTDIEKRPYFQQNKDWMLQVQSMQRLKTKAEIQSLSALSPKFLTEVYLPTKIRLGGWL